MSSEALSVDHITGLGLTDWRVLQGPMYARYRTGDFATGLRFVTEVATLAEAANHHPDVDLRYGWVQIRLFSHDVRARTQRDVDLARQISAAAHAMDVHADPEAMTVVEFGLDTWDVTAILPFWLAVYGLPHVADEVVDPAAFVPTTWFQQTGEHQTPRQRWHPDVWVAPEAARRRIDAALLAGGTVVDDSHSPSFVVLADPQGNRVCICTAIGR